MIVPGDVFETGLVLGGRYRLETPIGAGGMAVVWQAHDDVLDRAVAVKMVAPSRADDAGSRERIRYEARAAAALSHPNIAQVHDYGETDSAGRVVPYVVMELVPGGTLLARLSAGPPAPRFAMRVGAEIAAALAAAHAEGLVHRDIKPGNVMLAPTGAKVVDFGIAAAITPAGAVSGDGGSDDRLLGTPAYLAPERLIGDAVVPASDVYALGVVLYRMLSGRSPWSSEDTRQMLEAHLYVPPAPLPAVADVPDYVVALVNRCLAKDPVQRPRAEEVAEILALGAGVRVVTDEPGPRARAGESHPEAWTGGPHPRAGAGAEPSVLVRPVRRSASASEPPGPPSEPPGPSSEPARSGRSRTPVRLAVAAVLLAAAGGGAWLLSGGPEQAGAGGPIVAGESPVPAQPSGAPARSAGVTLPSAGATRTAGRAPGDAAGPVAGQPGAPGAPGAPGLPGAPGVTTVVPPAAGPATATTTATTGGPTAADPTTADPAVTTTAATATTAPAVERTLSSTGGTVVATCPAAGTARLLSWKATSPYKVTSADPGPAAAPRVAFKHGNRAVTMTVTCNDGIPSATAG